MFPTFEAKWACDQSSSILFFLTNEPNCLSNCLLSLGFSIFSCQTGDFLDNPVECKKELLKKWESVCKEGITSAEHIELTDELKLHIDSIDFSIFTSLDPQKFIEQHKQTSYYSARFGGGLNKRTKPTINKIHQKEMSLRYVEQLFEAYTDHSKTNIKTLDELNTHSELFGHFNRQRECFYWAEALNQFSRDSLPTGNTCFEDLKEEIYQAVVDTSNLTYPSGFTKVVATTNEASKVNIQSNALIQVSQVQDKIGICHHLANEDKLIWVKK